jgi:hypothetical protein
MCVGPPKQGHLEKKRKKSSYAVALKFNKCHGDNDGRFCSAPDSGGGGGRASSTIDEEVDLKIPKHLTPAQREMQKQLAIQAKKPVHQCKTAEEAVERILRGENVEIIDTRDVHTVLKKLGELAIEAKKQGKDAPNWDACLMTVRGASLFCTEKIKTEDFPHGIPRIEMPQFKSKNPVPGSEADKLPRDDNGEVDATREFLKHLEIGGVKSDPNAKILARKLKASQAEMEGAKVAGMMLSNRDPKKARITVTSDGYVLDGHHTWAAAVGRDAEDGNLDNDMEMEVVMVDMPMSQVYHLSVAWTKKFGLPAAGVKKLDYFVVLRRNHVA